MRIHYLQHVPFEGLGYIAEWARSKDHSLTATALYADEPLPEPHEFDFLIIMGGPMGVYDTVEHTWLIKEKYFIEAAFKAEKRILGICLGAQLMADVLGANVFKNEHKEIGWHQVDRITAADNTKWSEIIQDRFFAFHWHGDTFDLPTGALHIAQSEACRHQAFFYPPAAIGLQFHLESTQDSIRNLIQHCGHELIPSPYIQTETEILNQNELIKPSNDCMRSILESVQQTF